MATLPVSAQANQPPTERNSESTWTGTVTAVSAQNKTLTGKYWWFSKTFNFGQRCAISTVDNKEASLTDLRPGEQVKVQYQDVEGVLVADRIVEQALHYGGTVHAVDPKAGTVTMEQPPLYQTFRAPETFRIAGECRVMLANGDQGTLADVRPGDRVTVIYELPGGSRVAYRIRDRSSTFVGTLDAIDLSVRTVKAKKLAGEKAFTLADKCRIIASNQQSGHLKDLVLGHQYRFTYRDVNGINVLDRIAPAQEAKPTETASTR
jgi:hypothetical protein